MDNLRLYNEVRAVPDIAKKKITGGRLSGFTDINPMWRIKMLTEQFGVAGVGWYIEEVGRWTEEMNGEKACFVKIHLFIRNNGDWSMPIVGIGGSALIANEKGGLKLLDEAYKMAYTDSISVACKALGIGADVYYEKDSSSKYENAQNTKTTKSNPYTGTSQEEEEDNQLLGALQEVKAAKSAQSLTQIWNNYKTIYGQNKQFVEAVRESPCNPKNKRVWD